MSSNKIMSSIVTASLKRLAKKRISSGNNKEQTSAILYFLAASACCKDCEISYDKGIPLNERKYKDTLLMYYKRFSQVGETTYGIAEFGYVEQRNRTAENICRANFLSTAVARASRATKFGEGYPTRPDGGQVLSLGMQIGATRLTAARRAGWEHAMEILLSERNSPTPWTDLAITCFRAKPVAKETEIVEFLYNSINEVFDETLAIHWKRKISTESPSLSPSPWALVTKEDDPLEIEIQAMGNQKYTTEELEERLAKFTKFIKKLGYNPNEI